MKMRNQWLAVARSFRSAVMTRGLADLQIRPGCLVVFSATPKGPFKVRWAEGWPGVAYREPNLCRVFLSSMWPGAAGKRWV